MNRTARAAATGLAAVLALWTGTGTIAAPVPESERGPVDLRRTTLIVRDVDRALAFYRDALGLKVVYDQVIIRPPRPGDPAEVDRKMRRALLRANDAGVSDALRDDVVRCWMGAEAYTLETYRTVSRLLAGGKIGFEASLNKIFWSELDIRMHELALSILGDRGELLPEAPAADGVGTWLDSYLFALSGPIYAGTNEIQRNIVAERILGLPR